MRNVQINQAQHTQYTLDKTNLLWILLDVIASLIDCCFKSMLSLKLVVKMISLINVFWLSAIFGYLNGAGQLMH